MKKHSLKKSLGTIGTFVVYLLSLYGGYKLPATIPQIIGVLVVYNSALFSIKKYGTKVFPEEK